MSFPEKCLTAMMSWSLIWLMAFAVKRAGADDAQDLGGSVGINGAPCAFNTVAAAIAAASAGDMILVMPGMRNEFLGEIDRSLTLVPSTAGCAAELTTAVATSVVFDVNGSSNNSQGGLMRVTSAAEVTIRHMWLRDASASEGGVIAVMDESHLILDDVWVTDGVAQNNGGNVFVSSDSGALSQLTLINDSRVYRGTAMNGGAIALIGSVLNMDHAQIGISNISGFSVASNNGGGIHAVQAVIQLDSTQSSVQWNQAGQNGGGMYLQDSDVVITGTDISHNTAEFGGGGMYLDNTFLTMSEAVMDGNSTQTLSSEGGGGAIHLVDFSSASLRLSTLNDNLSADVGGAIAARAATELFILQDTILQGNVAQTLGGGIYTSGNLTIDDSTLINHQAAEGGAIHCAACNDLLIVNGSLIADNLAGQAAGVDANSGVRPFGPLLAIIDSAFQDNVASDDSSMDHSGGAVRQFGGQLIVSNSTFTDNIAPINGGAVYVTEEEQAPLIQVQILDSAFVSNETTGSSNNQGGGALYIEDAEQVEITDTLFLSNSSFFSGGAVMINNSQNVVFSGGSIDANTAKVGGGMDIQGSDVMLKDQAAISQNVGQFSVGGLLFTDGSLSLRDAVFDDNETTFGSGGGLAIFDSVVDIRNSRISNNFAGFRGGGLFLEHSTAYIGSLPDPGPLDCKPLELMANDDCMIFTGNRALNDGGAIHVSDSLPGITTQLVMDRAALRSNSSEGRGSVLFAQGSDLVLVELSNLLVVDNGDDTLVANDSGIEGNLSDVIEAAGHVELELMSSTVANNSGSPLVLVDLLISVGLLNNIFHDNQFGPNVSVGGSVRLGCNLSQLPSEFGIVVGIQDDPQFTTTVRGDYRLADTSPSRDACSNGPSRDLDGLFRPGMSVLFDQGAFEMDGLIMLPDDLFEDGFED